MKKVLSIILVLAMVLCMAACGGKETASSAPAASTPAASTPASSSAAPAAPAEETHDPLTLKLCCSETETSVLGKNLQWVVDEFNKFSDITTIEFYPNNQLGSLDDMEEQVSSGAPLMVSDGAGNLGKYAEHLGILGVPYILSGLYDYMYAPQTDWYKQNVQGDLDANNITLLSFQSNGYRHFIGSHAIQHVSDVASTVLRMGPNPQLQGFASIMGGSPTTSTWADNYTLIQAGTIDCCEAAIDLLWTSSLYEVSQYLSLTGHFTTPSSVFMNTDIFNMLTAAEQAKLLELFNQLAINVSDEMIASEADYIKQFEEVGTNVIYPEDIDIDEFKSYMPKLCASLGYDEAEVQEALDQIAAAAKADGR